MKGGFAPIEDYRVVIELAKAWRGKAMHKPRGSNAAAARGLTYERRVGRELAFHRAFGRFAELEHNPWFQFIDLFGAAACCPDFLLHHVDGSVTIVEVKLTWVAHALPKLRDLYIPVVERALGVVASPLVICHNLATGAGNFETSLGAAIASQLPLVWPRNGRIPW